MRLIVAFVGMGILLAACGQPTPVAITSVAIVTQAPDMPTSLPSPTATSIADGVSIRLGTPDPSPNCPDHIPWFFANPAQECATTPGNKWAVVQHFEHGLMVWFQDYGETYVLMEDGSPFKPYRQAIDTVGLANPTELNPSLTPPSGLYQPVAGFAKFWRALVPGSDWVRPTLGWATAPELAYSSFYQCNTNSDNASRCYWLGPQDEIFVFARGSAAYWAYVKGPRP